MKRLLHIIAAPRGEESRTLRVSTAFLSAFLKKYPSCRVDELNLWKEKLPPLSVEVVKGKYVLLGGGDLSGRLKDAWKDVVSQIERFLSAEIYLLSTPMWNFHIPYVLKHYIDVIVQPKYLFRYTETGVDGLAKGRKMIVITSRGGDYRPGSPFQSYDCLEPYLKTIFGFVGITDITFINAQPMDAAGPDVAKAELGRAEEMAVNLSRLL